MQKEYGDIWRGNVFKNYIDETCWLQTKREKKSCDTSLELLAMINEIRN